MNIEISKKASERLKSIIEAKHSTNAKIRIFLAGIG